jgi:pimeloyl-ACP methyl ester carboxylesterase
MVIKMIKTKVNGIAMAYERYGKGTPLVLLHGYPLDHTIWEPVVPLLENNFDMILPDLRGFGESQAPAKTYGMADFAADIAALLSSLNIWQAGIAGHSMGGYVALAFARAYPQRTLGLGLVASQVLADSPEKKAGRYQEADDILAHGVREVAEGMSVKLTTKSDLQGWLKELILRQRPEGLAGALRAMADRSDSSALLLGSDFPVVLIHGLVDKLIPIERARSVKVAVPNAHLAEIPDVGHMPMMEAPQMVAQALRFLKVVQ